MNISELYDPEFRKLIKSKKQTVIIPVGSIEQHGAHLPISTDSDIVTEIASRLAKKCNFILFPTLNYGISFEHSPFFNTSIKESTLKKLLFEICNSLVKNNIKSIVILNGHHGNMKTLQEFHHLTPKLRSILGIKVRCYSYWHFMKHEFDHAGFVETSIMLAISNKANMKKAKKGLMIKDLSKKEKERISKLASKSFPSVAKNGVWGDPTSATKKDGKKLLAEIVRNLTKKCQS